VETEDAAGEIGAATQKRSRALPGWARLVLVVGVLLLALAGFFAFDLDRYLSLQGQLNSARRSSSSNAARWAANASMSAASRQNP
jgi:hypothetical protein